MWSFYFRFCFYYFFFPSISSSATASNVSAAYLTRDYVSRDPHLLCHNQSRSIEMSHALARVIFCAGRKRRPANVSSQMLIRFKKKFEV